MRIFALLLSLALSSTVLAETDCLSKAKNIDEKLSCISDLSFKEIFSPAPPSGARHFWLSLQQPVDHNNPGAGHFQQRIILLHRNESEPMVLYTGGYGISVPRQTLLTASFATNQLQVEHRHFGPSSPDPKDWTKLNIKQSADDFHRIVQALKPIYQGRWINTGGSKGGMTSIYHRRFYPNDLDGTIADVAPHSVSDADPRYITFVESVGGTAYESCRNRWQTVQIELLKNRDTLVPLVKGNFNHLGGADVAFEHAVIEASYIFWQYRNPDDSAEGCPAIPDKMSVDKMFAYLQKINNVNGYTDGAIPFPYTYQAATQLGSPAFSTAHLKHLQRYPFHIVQYAPKGFSYQHDPKPMKEVTDWLLREGSQIIFGYGEFDPWTAGEFPINPASNEVYKFIAPKANHGAKFKNFKPGDKEFAIKKISDWLGKRPVLSIEEQENGLFLEDVEFELQKRSRSSLGLARVFRHHVQIGQDIVELTLPLGILSIKGGH